LIICNKLNSIGKNHYLFLQNAFLSQDSDDLLLKKKLKVVTRKKPSPSQISSLKFAFGICKFVKSNAIVLAKDKSTIGIGAGQPSRLDSCKIASRKALQFAPEKILNSVAASDAFFPFPDGIKELAETGVEAIIQPGGSINDKKVIKAANNAGLVMLFTGTRHFKH
jgi:phosphoribosylaminoimidazolecarboxamide formyltransferase/IMP cyclohydrolase